MNRTLALSSIFAVALVAVACGDRTQTPQPKDTVALDSLSLSAINCQWWYRNADPAPMELKKRHLRCVIAGQVVRVDTSGVGQNGGE